MLNSDDINCVRLWRGVLLQAFKDLLGEPKRADTVEAVQNRAFFMFSARRWFLARNEDLAVVCTLAGIDPDTIATVAAAMIEALDANDLNRAYHIRRPLFAMLNGNPDAEDAP